MNNTRNYGIDLLKVLSMFGILCMHLTNRGGTWGDGTDTATTTIVLKYVSSFFSCSVNIFAMITGYLNIKKTHTKYAGLINLLFTVVFWCGLLTGIAYIFAPQYLNELSIIKCLSPFSSETYWYFNCYIILFIFIPFLNRLVLSVSKKQFRFLLTVLFVMICCVSTVVRTDLFAVSGGYSSLWLIVCYLAGAYIRLYANENTVSAKTRVICILVPLINTAIIMVAYVLANRLFGAPIGYNLLVSYTSPLPVVNAVMLIVLFSGIKTKSKLLQAAFTSASKASFSVYIAHGHDIVFMSILGGAFVFLNAYNPITALFVWLGWAFAIYLVIWIIDMIRAVLFKLTKLDLLCDKIGGLIDRFSGINKA